MELDRGGMLGLDLANLPLSLDLKSTIFALLISYVILSDVSLGNNIGWESLLLYSMNW